MFKGLQLFLVSAPSRGRSIRLSRKLLHSYKINGWMWGCWGRGEIGERLSWSGTVQAADVLASLCACQPPGIFQVFLPGMGDFDLAPRGLLSYWEKLRRYTRLTVTCLTSLSSLASGAPELGVSEEVEIGWRGKWRSDDKCWLRSLDFILGPVKSYKRMFSEGMKNPDCALEMSLSS